MRHVFVKKSQIPFAGEGLWAKTDIKVTQFCLVLRSLSIKLNLLNSEVILWLCSMGSNKDNFGAQHLNKRNGQTTEYAVEKKWIWTFFPNIFQLRITEPLWHTRSDNCIKFLKINVDNLFFRLVTRFSSTHILNAFGIRGLEQSCRLFQMQISRLEKRYFQITITLFLGQKTRKELRSAYD